MMSLPDALTTTASLSIGVYLTLEQAETLKRMEPGRIGVWVENLMTGRYGK